MDEDLVFWFGPRPSQPEEVFFVGFLCFGRVGEKNTFGCLLRLGTLETVFGKSSPQPFG